MSRSRFQDLFSLEGRVALVTGGARGLGRSIAEGLIEQGAKVYLTSRDEQAGAATAAELSRWGDCESVAVDVASEAGITQLARHLEAREPALDILVNNAGAVWAHDFDTFPQRAWDKVVDLNLKAPFFLAQAFAPMLRRAAVTRTAKVINISSIDALSVNGLETYSYAASKAGLVHLTRRLSLRLAEDNIAVTCIAPGMFPSDMNRRARDSADELAMHIPAGRVGGPDDIASAVIYLASTAGDYVMGETLVVDGGLTWQRSL